MDLLIILIFIVVFCVVYAYKQACTPKGLPPGPPGLPFVGHLFSLYWNKQAHHNLNSYRRRYGPIYSLQLGWYPTLVISCPKLLREAFVQHADKCSNRPKYLIQRLLSSDKGIVDNHGPLWSASRRLALSCMRDFGMGKATMEQVIQQETRHLVTELSKSEGKPLSLELIFSKVTANVIFTVLFSSRCDYHEKEFNILMQTIHKFFTDTSQFSPTIMVPGLMPLFFIDRNAWNGAKMMIKFRHYIQKQIKEHRMTFSPTNIRDFADVFLDAERKNTGQQEFNEENILSIMSDLLIAGTETTSNTLRWAVYFMIKYPMVQDKCRTEIINVIASDSSVQTSDRDNMPYVEATICEIQRMSTIVPFGVPHCTKGSFTFHGFTIPDKTLILSNLYSIHMDPDLWDDPEIFKPERFLNSNGAVMKPQCFMPFSLGKRVCAGESLAKMELYIVFTTLLQKFRFNKDETTELVDESNAQFGLTLSPPPFKAILTLI